MISELEENIMGQRSQIYVRYNVNDESGQNYKGLIARYFGWNYGEKNDKSCKIYYRGNSGRIYEI